jgi:hypothetical protein
MVANLYSMQGKPVPEMPATPKWNIVSFIELFLSPFLALPYAFILLGQSMTAQSITRVEECSASSTSSWWSWGSEWNDAFLMLMFPFRSPKPRELHVMLCLKLFLVCV